MHRMLRDLAKVGVGLVLADIFSALWLDGSGFFPLTILGTTWTAAAVMPIVVFDTAVILLLIHYGWNTKLPLRSPAERTLLVVAGSIFLIVALLHLARLAFGWNLVLGDFVVPLWLSWFGFLITLYLSYSSFHFAFRKGR